MATAPADLHRPLCNRFGIFRLPLRTLSDSAHSLSVGTEGVAYLRSRDGWFGAKMIVTSH
jgi:hypothetical protein